MTPLPEDAPIGEIEAFFADHGLALQVHEDAPPTPSDDEWRRMSSVERAARKATSYSHWANLARPTTGEVVHRWYGGGMTADEAIRSARSRWRVEQEGHPEEPRRLP